MPATKKSTTATGKATTGIHAVVGSDHDAVARTAKELSIRLKPDGGDEFSIQSIDGQVDTVDAAVTAIYEANQALLTLPFFGGKLVWLRNATFLSDSVTGRSESVLGALERLQATLESGLPNGVTFLFSALSPDKRRAFYKKLGALADLSVFDKVDTGKSGWEDAVAGNVKAHARELGLTFRPDAMELFVLFVGADSGQALSDLQKIDLYLGKDRRQVEVDDVLLLVPESHAGAIWQISNAITARRLDDALEAVTKFLGRGESAIGLLLAAILPTVRNLLYAKDLLVTHRMRSPGYPNDFLASLKRLSDRDTAHLPRKKDGSVNTWQLGMSACAAGKYELAELRHALAACLEANLQLVTSQLSAHLVLARLLVKIIAKKPH